MASTALSTALAPYLQIMEQEITADLARIVDPEKLRDEVRRALATEVTKQASAAVNDLGSQLMYGTEDSVRRSEAKALRAIGYLQQLIVHRDSQRLLSAPADEEEEAF